MAADAVIINLSVYLTLLLRFEARIPDSILQDFIHLIPVFTIVTLFFMAALKLYGRIWEYASLGEMMTILRAVTYSMAVILLLIYLFKIPGLPRSVYIGAWMMLNASIGASRLSWRIIRTIFKGSDHQPQHNVLIVGAGDAGALLVREIRSNPQLHLKAVGIVDDDHSKRKLLLFQVPVLGDRSKIPVLVRDLEVDEIIIAMPSASGQIIREILKIARTTTARVKILPGIYNGLSSSALAQLREVNMEDLLRREPVAIDLEEIATYISGKTVLITGAGGSIGSELCRQVLSLHPARLVMVDNCENNLFDIEMELIAVSVPGCICPELNNTQHREMMERVFRKYHPQVVFHAAAYKHVPMMERHPNEAFYNNVIGTKNTAELADDYGVETFILVSTDKAVNPTSVMGASKRLAELVIKDINRSSKTRFAAVRFGNVLGSRGSVVPTFIKQIEKGGPVTVTHPEMKRYFMTIPEAVQLIIQAGAMARGSETFVLDMGEPVKISDLASDLIRLTGREPGQDIQIEYTGIRPGEKLYEELFTDREGMASTKHQRIFISKNEIDDKYINVGKTLQTFAKNGIHSKMEFIQLIANLLPEYQAPEDMTLLKEKKLEVV
jgi:FlaA1/EpsC-like NDP-sugar epimerase